MILLGHKCVVCVKLVKRYLICKSGECLVVLGYEFVFVCGPKGVSVIKLNVTEKVHPVSIITVPDVVIFTIYAVVSVDLGKCH